MCKATFQELLDYRTRLRWLIHFFIGLSTCLISTLSNALTSTDYLSLPRGTHAPTRREVEAAIDLSAGYIERSCDQDGRLVYQVNTTTGARSTSYNIIRHAGVIYSLGMLQQERPSQRIKRVMLRAGAYLRKNAISPGIRPGMLVVWPSPTDRSEAELGATGLGLVALAAVWQQQPKAVPLVDLQALGRFILSCKERMGASSANTVWMTV